MTYYDILEVNQSASSEVIHSDTSKKVVGVLGGAVAAVGGIIGAVAKKSK